MCGIVGYIGARSAQGVLVGGLRRLEYRGYDSAGIAVLNDKPGSRPKVSLQVKKRKGKLHALEAFLKDRPLKGNTGIGHCLHPQTLVCLTDGRTIPISDVQDNDEVMVVGLKALECRNGKTVKVFSHPSPPFLYQVKTPYFSFKCTGEHRIFVGEECGAVRKKPVKEIRDELIAMPKVIPYSKNKPQPLKIVKQEFHYLLTGQTRKLLKRARLKKGLSLVKASRAAKVGKLYIERLEKGSRLSAEGERLGRILNTYDVPGAISSFKLCNFKTNNITFPLRTNKDLMQIIGYHTGDGFAWKRMIRYKDADKDVVDVYKGLYEKVFGFKNIVIHERKGHSMFRVNSKFLVDWFAENFNESFLSAKDKDLPSFLSGLPEDHVAAFLRGLYDAEGSVTLKGRQLCLSMTGQNAIERAQLLLLRFGVLATYVHKNKRKRRWNDIYSLLVSDKKSLRNFHEKIGFSADKKQKRLLKLISSMKGLTVKHFPTPLRFKAITPYLKKYKIKEKGKPYQRITEFRLKKIVKCLKENPQTEDDPQLQVAIENIDKFIHSDIVWVQPEIKKIPSDTDRVYDLEVDDYHNFIGNGILQHNSRWATHGIPNTRNAHPHADCTRKIALVHNGIIENYEELKEALIKEGHKFLSETDTEVLVHLVEKFYKGRLEDAVRQTLKKVRGAYAIAVISTDEPGKLVGARQGSPLVAATGKDEGFLASDIPALLDYTNEVILLDDGEIVTLQGGQAKVTNLKTANPIKKKKMQVNWDVSAAEKEGYPHFMLKEIHEQPHAIANTLMGRISDKKDAIILPELEPLKKILSSMRKLVIISCGTAWHAGLVGKYMIEQCARIPVEVDISSEFRYRDPIIDDKTLILAITQSGETADTLAGIREAKSRGAKILSICNVLGSSIPRESHAVLYTHAGPEMAVASTKAYTCQLAVLYLLTLYLAKLRGTLPAAQIKQMIAGLEKIPQSIEKVLEDKKVILQCARRYYRSFGFLYLGRALNFPTALEGALKIKEISYMHAEGYGAGEMKHGPIALINPHLPVVCIAPESHVHDKMLSNIQEIKARKGIVISIATVTDKLISHHSNHVIYIPKVRELFSPLLTVIPLQLLAYYIAAKRGCDIDQPKNLAKSVTVE